jgi:succinate-semialdehyde dehydrogenase/glutarate-semialdehyde dehydrogenase
VRGDGVNISVNPATGQELGRFADHGDVEIDAKVSAAVAAQAVWRKQAVEQRAAVLPRLAGLLRERKQRYARLITDEMGKPLADSLGEIEKCAWNCEFYAQQAPAFLADTQIASAAAWSGVVYDPMGVVLAVMPWNYPFWQFFRFAAPALAAGNGIVLKHAANVPQCLLAMGELMNEIGLPDGLCATILAGPDTVMRLIADDRIAAVTLTGSTRVGALVAAEAGKALKKQVLELGGSDPFLVLKDADIAAAAKAAAMARFNNAGQSCINAKRFIVVEEVADAFVEAFVEEVKALPVGDPCQDGIKIGPLARADLRATLHDQVTRSIAAGARLKLGGVMPQGTGFFYPLTILDHVAPGMAAFDEETFGPAAAIVRAKDEDQAIALANQTEFGLGAAIWSRDLTRARTIARRIEAGAVFINALVASDPRLPFGGIKRSGYGRELGELGIREFVNAKTLSMGKVA